MFRAITIVLIMLVIGGCQAVEPWERDRLSRKDMQLIADPLEAQRTEQIFFSKEASSGGSAAAGGGCGCN